MKTNVSYEEALKRADEDLRIKIQYSVSLLKKAERLANIYSEDGFYLAFSGGKDSQALYHVAELAGVKFHAEYSVTTCDPPELIRFIKSNYPEVSFTKPSESIYSKCNGKHQGLLPTGRVRWCCAEFKESQGSNKVTLTGVRKSESARRSKRNEVEITNRKFSGNIEEFKKFRKDKFEKQKDKKEDEYLKFRCVKGKDSLVVMPIIYWDERDVWEFLNNVMRVPHCKLYDEGNSRIGCILCPMKSYREKLLDIKRYPHHKHRWIGVILKKYESKPEQINKYLPAGIDVFNTSLEKETVESFGGKYPQRWIESAEAYFDYWLKHLGYEKWYSEQYKQTKMFGDQ